ncbi:odorant receptor 4-like [Ostrinia nubilalis]|uniref:odorant receptor 4-like n=1 Tax=Ostrinia nubilalis TaxID=29057 RepID=UPI00308227BE
MFALSVTSCYVLQQGVYAYQERGDLEKLARVLFVLLCHCTCVAKQLVFHAQAARVDRIIAGLHQPLFDPATAGAGASSAAAAAARALLRATSRGAARLLRAYYGCAVATCVLWTIFPVVYKLRGFRIEFPFWTFLDYNQPVMFVIVLLHSFYATNLVAVGNTTMDAFIATVMYQCKTQLRILRMNFETLPERARALTKESVNANYEEILTKLLFECIQHFQKIADTMALLEQVFGLAVLVQFTVGGWILCMAAYKIVSVNVLSFEFASTTLFIVCILTELFLYCYYGNEVTVESDRMVEAVYAMEWLHAPLRFKRSLVLVMERAKRPLRPAAGHLIPLSLDTFVTILKSSYSFYAVLRQTK